MRSVASHLRALPAAQLQEAPKPSHFIPSAVKPLQDYFGKNGYGNGLKDQVGAAWSHKVMEEIIVAYTTILASVQKTEDLLRRHRKGKKGAFSLFGSSNASSASTIEQEEERFKQQMLVDIRKLGQMASELGVEVETDGEKQGVAGWSTLLDTAEKNGEFVCQTWKIRHRAYDLLILLPWRDNPIVTTTS